MASVSTLQIFKRDSSSLPVLIILGSSVYRSNGRPNSARWRETEQRRRRMIRISSIRLSWIRCCKMKPTRSAQTAGLVIPVGPRGISVYSSAYVAQVFIGISGHTSPKSSQLVWTHGQKNRSCLCRRWATQQLQPSMKH
ncbi:hypothetical protein RvY_10660-2 [Ramazzottius varieornatus]|uniref:Uncharacterized protein n=1 Tax=Ramazzottius varieornatus TaxID=947166 RepID=A0A1D1VFK3_RAMVA|nr:hypothetical protein RvY_10660-2 [Ramazzottius varieornatus]